MSLGHVLVTYFSVRIDTYWEPLDRNNPHRTGDPLDPASLGNRMALFETICLPSVVAQSSQAFSWVIIIDPELTEEFRVPLQKMTAAHENIHIHVFSEDDKLADCDWLVPYLGGQNYSHIITSLLDSDDALPADFVEQMQNSVLESQSRQPVPFCILGCGRVNQWDLIQTPDAPRGYTAESWHRNTGSFLLSPGFSVMSQYPEINVSNLLLRHRLSDHYLDWSRLPDEPNVSIVRDTLVDRGRASGMDIKAMVGPSEHREMHAQIGKPLLVNHTGNVQADRLLEDKRRQKVDVNNDLGEYNIDWDKYEANADLILTRMRSFPRKRPRVTLKRLVNKVRALF